MRVLITYASAGAGHRRAAEAIYDYLKNNRKELALELVDILPFASRFFRFCYNSGYPFLVHYAIWLWGSFFWMTEFKPTRWLSRKSSFIVNYLGCRKFVRYLIKEDFDFIISTHFLNSELVANLKLRNKIRAKLVTVITDFGVHPFWVSKGTDIYIAASRATRDKLLNMGVPEEQIQDSGIPISSSFTRDKNRAQLAEKLGIAGNKFTVLLMTGSFGSGPLEEIAESLCACAQVQVLVVCAKNKKLFSRLQKKDLENVKTFGFVNNAEELMGVSDIIVTKPGGLSIAELLNMGLIPIFISAIPGQEQENINILAGYGVGCAPEGIKQIKALVVELKNDPQKLESFKENVIQAAKPSACREISSVIR
ncbi:MAG: glycosyltransferase [Candidatus Omnitrophica bacterium]|nr:glycosyltransferase [Candidatus Omnitrophota bacterium]